jgi:PST family polysaccharide transporter
VGYERIFSFSLILLISEALFPFWFLQGLGNLKWVTIGNLLSKLIYLLLLTVFVIESSDAYLVNLLLGICIATVNIGLLITLIKKYQLSIGWVRLSRVVYRIKENLHYFLTSIAGYVSAHSGIIILSYFSTATVLGEFGLAQRVASLMRLVPTLVVQSALPRASQLYVEDERKFIKYVRSVLLMAVGLTLLIGISVIPLAEFVILLLSGGNNQLAVETLRLLAFVPFLAALNIGNIMLLIASDNKQLLFKGTSIAVIFILATSIVMTYTYGAIGLAISLLLSELITFVVQSLIMYPTLGALSLRIYGKSIGSDYPD